MRRLKKVLIFQKVGYSNAGIIKILSFFYQVKVFEFQNTKIRSLLKNVELVNMSETYTVDEIDFFRNAIAEKIIKLTANRKISAKNNLVKSVLLQKLGILVEKVYLYLNQPVNKDHFFMFGLEETMILKEFPEIMDIPIKVTDNYIRKLVIIFEYFTSYIFYLLYTGTKIIKMLKYIPKLTQKKEFNVLNDSVNTNELVVGEQKRSVLWPIYNFKSANKKMLFILDTQNSSLKRFLLNHNISFVQSTLGTLVYLSIMHRFIILLSFLANFFRQIFTIRMHKRLELFYSIEKILLTKIVNRCGISSYLTSASNIGNEKPIVLLLNELKVKTIMYFYSANSFNYTKKLVSQSNYCIFNFIFSTEIYVWHDFFAAYLKRFDYNGKIRVTGPLMPGKEFNPRTAKIYRQMLVKTNLFAISIFDVPPANPQSVFAQSTQWPDYNDEEGVFNFLKDCLKLLDVMNVVIIYKPKRNLFHEKFKTSDRISSLLKKRMKNERFIILEDNINPWLPPLVADMSIGMPFTSPVLISLNYGLPSIFHDSLNRAIHHQYRELNSIITHSYQELENKVRSFLKGKHNRQKKSKFVCTPQLGGYTRNMEKYLLK